MPSSGSQGKFSHNGAESEWVKLPAAKLQQVNVRIEEKKVRLAKQLAVHDDTTLNHLFDEALSIYLAGRGGELSKSLRQDADEAENYSRGLTAFDRSLTSDG